MTQDPRKASYSGLKRHGKGRGRWGCLVPVTQELLAEMLGVRRQSVDHVLGELETKQMIECLRGSVKIHDVDSLRSVACECYPLAKERLDNSLT